MNDRKLKNDQRIRHLLQGFLLFMAILFLSSCGTYLPQPQEMGNMALLRSFAVDKGETWQVTVSTGQQRQGTSTQDALILQGQGLTIQGACRDIDGYSKDYVFYGYIDQLILGKALAEEGMMKALQYFATEDKLSLGTGIWLSEGEASTLLSQAPEEGVGEHLQTLAQDSNLGIGGIHRKVGEVLTDLKEQGGSFIPILGEDLRELGYGIVKNDVLVDLFQGEEAKGFQLLACHPQLVELNLPEGGYAFQVETIRREIQGNFQGETLESVEIILHIQGELKETPLHQRENIQSPMENHLQSLGDLALSSLQTQGADVLNFQGELALSHPSASGQWDWDFQNLPMNCQVCLSILSP